MMAEAILEKAVCEKCEADIRENTLFCYNCGNKFGDVENESSAPAEISNEARTALDDLAARLKASESENEDKIKLAAAERRKARVAPKRKKEVVWEATEGRSGGVLFIISLLIFLMVVGVVFVTVYWK